MMTSDWRCRKTFLLRISIVRVSVDLFFSSRLTTRVLEEWQSINSSPSRPCSAHHTHCSPSRCPPHRKAMMLHDLSATDFSQATTWFAVRELCLTNLEHPPSSWRQQAVPGRHMPLNAGCMPAGCVWSGSCLGFRGPQKSIWLVFNCISRSGAESPTNIPSVEDLPRSPRPMHLSSVEALVSAHCNRYLSDQRSTGPASTAAPFPERKLNTPKC